ASKVVVHRSAQGGLIRGTLPDAPVLDIRIQELVVEDVVLVPRDEAWSRPGGIVLAVREELLVPILPIHQHRLTDLLHVAQTHRLPRLLARLRENGKEDRGEDGDNGYHDEQLNEREPSLPLHLLPPFHREGPSVLDPSFAVSEQIPARSVCASPRLRHPSPRKARGEGPEANNGSPPAPLH